MRQAATIALRNEMLERPDLRRLYDEHAPSVRALARRLLGPDTDPDDLVQDVFLVAWRRRASVSPQTALGFLYGTAVRLAVGLRRRHKVRHLFGLSATEAVADWRTPEAVAEQRDAQRTLYRILDEVPERRRSVFVLHELHGLTGAEIAVALGCPINTVWSRLAQARREYLAAVQAFRARASKDDGEQTP